MTTRRRLLAGCAAGLAGLAGCSGLSDLPGAGEDSPERVDVRSVAGDLSRVDLPESPFPAAVPPSLAEAHRERTRELLSDVPREPEIPNGAVRSELVDERERAADDVNDEEDVHQWPVEALGDWRRRRGEAAAVRGAYRAATGEGDGEDLAERRQSVRASLGEFAADWAYRAPDPVAAVLAHAPVESTVHDCRTLLEPHRPYPEDPLAAPFRAGDAVGDVERADAALADATGLRAAALDEWTGPPSQWSPIVSGTQALRHSLAETMDDRIEWWLDAEYDDFDRDLEGTPARWLFYEARRRVQSRERDARQARERGDHATAVVEAAQALVATEVFETVVDGMRDGAYGGETTADRLRESSRRAREAVQAALEERSALDGNRPALAVALLRPALLTQRSLVDRLAEGYGSADRALGEFAWAELYARTVPDAAPFVAERLREAAETADEWP
ncbi:hypothetical protein [Halomicrobium salinisoli]|uniref:hypothetical protein n=1 Tax=Halomicrobium salinisoli TaxID=2878391 RepID=UPI001CEFDC51|nr:hypothetical protein [Halomicrobium salinisoli]